MVLFIHINKYIIYYIEKRPFLWYNNPGDNMKFKNVFLASDFDGTLKTDTGIITDEVKSSIADFMSRGGFFTVCTGRIYQGFHLYSPEYINAPVLLGNGAMA